MERYVSAIIFLLILWIAILAWRVRRRQVTVGPGAAGMMHEMLSDDRRAAVEIMVEEKAGYRDPEDRDDNLPDLEDPNRKTRATGR